MDYENISFDIEDVKEPYDSIINLIGLKDTVKLSQQIKGTQIIFKKKYDLNEDFLQISECIGKEKAELIIKCFIGEQIYFCDLKKCLDIKKLIIKEFNGFNYRELAHKFGYSERSIRRITKNKQ